MDVPNVNVVDGLAVAEADAAVADAAVAASSRCPGVAAVVAPWDVMMLDDDVSRSHSSCKLLDASKSSG